MRVSKEMNEGTKNKNKKTIKCLNCGYICSIDDNHFPMRCTKCGSPALKLGLTHNYINYVKKKIFEEDFKNLPPSHQKYKSFMPLYNNEKLITIGEGGTPLIENENLTKKSKSSKLLFKCEYMNPTGSFKDRGTSVEISKAIELGKKQ